MWQLALVLFVLERFRSPELAGFSVFLSIAPGILIAPVAGALLDRHGRVRLMIIDYIASALFLLGIVAIAVTGILSVPLLLVLVLATSLTNPIGHAGARSLFPLIVPRHLWDRANAVDSGGYTLTTIIGAPIAGIIAAYAGAHMALAATAVLHLAAAAVLFGLRDPRDPVPGGRLLEESLAGVRYVLGHATLRGLAAGVSTANLAHGIAIVGLPVLVLEHLGGNAAHVGQLWALMGIAAMATGRIGSEGRERQLLALSMLAVAAAVLLLARADSLLAVAIAVTILGFGTGPLDVALFSLRQRRTDPAWFGRAFAVSMYLNYSGIPFGSGIGGPLVAASVPLAFTVGAGFALLGAVSTMLLIPKRE
jgi:predicted MFS family arabinose efflux permease